MLQQVESTKEEIIIAAASSRHRFWRFSDGKREHPDEIKEDDLWRYQFISGIKTIAIIPLPSKGVIVFGSCPKILETMEFIEHVNRTLSSTSYRASSQTIQDSSTYPPHHTSVSVDSKSSQSTHISGMDFEDAHQFTNLDGFQKNHQAHTVKDEFSVSLDDHCQQDFACIPFGSLTTNQHSNISINDFSTMGLQIMEMIEMQQIQTASQPSTSGHFYGETSATYHGSNAPLGASSSNGQVFDNPQSSPLRSGSNHSHSHVMNPPKPECLSELVPMLAFQMNSRPMGNENLGVSSSSSGFSGSGDFGCRSVIGGATTYHPASSLSSVFDRKESFLDASAAIFSDSELFDSIELDLKNCSQAHRSWEDVIVPDESLGGLDPIPAFGVQAIGEPSKDCFSDFTLEQFVEAVSVGTPKTTDHNSTGIDNPVFCYNANDQGSVVTNMVHMTSSRNHDLPSGMPCFSGQGSVLFSEWNLDNLLQGSSSGTCSESQVRSWINDCNSMNVERAVAMLPDKSGEPPKIARKRARPGESTRPRPKDRQLIQDRVKELREIVPNSSKCSIDALLDHTIKHMLYLQSVTSYADKLKLADEPKMIGEDSGVVLRDNSSTGGGGATWAFEVAGQTMVCPIIVEDLSPPGQMLIEMLCEERGLFLEIADIIRGFGLIILKGVMEVRDSKIWSRFFVEASGNVTRMEVFLSLVNLLQHNNNNNNNANNLTNQPSKDIESGIATLSSYKQPPLPFPISLPGNFQ